MFDPANTPIADDSVGLLEGMATTRSIRRYKNEPVPDSALRDMLYAATRAPSGSNRQPFRFIVLSESEKARQAKQVIRESAQTSWREKRERDQYDKGSGADENSPKARMARTMERYVDCFHEAPVLILPCFIRYRAPDTMEGASLYPAVQNLLLAARGLGYGGVLTMFHRPVEKTLKELLGIPEEVFIGGTITIGRPAGNHGPVRRRPMNERVFVDEWGSAPDWAIDPPGTQHTSAGPPKQTKLNN